MPRAARKKSGTGIYHIVIRGINRQEIFLDDEDKEIFLDRLQKYKAECGFEVFAYCFMSNHVHLLIKEGITSTSEIMKKLESSYVFRFNLKYNRVGALFQDRYKSEAVENDAYLLTAVRYIHQNPVKIGLHINDWTSYQDYLSGRGITDTKPILEMFGEDEGSARKAFSEYMHEQSDRVCIDYENPKRLSDDEAKEIILKIAGISYCQELQSFDRTDRALALAKIKEKGISIRQLERLTGLNRGVILKA